jgi:hypothetical protein
LKKITILFFLFISLIFLLNINVLGETTSFNTLELSGDIDINNFIDHIKNGSFKLDYEIECYDLNHNFISDNDLYLTFNINDNKFISFEVSLDNKLLYESEELNQNNKIFLYDDEYLEYKIKDKKPIFKIYEGDSYLSYKDIYDEYISNLDLSFINYEIYQRINLIYLYLSKNSNTNLNEIVNHLNTYDLYNNEIILDDNLPDINDLNEIELIKDLNDYKVISKLYINYLDNLSFNSLKTSYYNHLSKEDILNNLNVNYSYQNIYIDSDYFIDPEILGDHNLYITLENNNIYYFIKSIINVYDDLKPNIIIDNLRIRIDKKPSIDEIKNMIKIFDNHDGIIEEYDFDNLDNYNDKSDIGNYKFKIDTKDLSNNKSSKIFSLTITYPRSHNFYITTSVDNLLTENVIKEKLIERGYLDIDEEIKIKTNYYDSFNKEGEYSLIIDYGNEEYEYKILVLDNKVEKNEFNYIYIIYIILGILIIGIVFVALIIKKRRK